MSVIQMLVIGGASLLVLIFFYMRGFTKGYNTGIEFGRLIEAIDNSREDPYGQEDSGMYDAPAYRVISDGRDTGSGSEEAAAATGIYDYDYHNPVYHYDDAGVAWPGVHPRSKLAGLGHEPRDND